MAEATLVKYGIVNAHGTDGYSIVCEYSDGSQSGAWGWFGCVASAEAALANDPETPIEDWTTDDDVDAE